MAVNRFVKKTLVGKVLKVGKDWCGSWSLWSIKPKQTPQSVMTLRGLRSSGGLLWFIGHLKTNMASFAV